MSAVIAWQRTLLRRLVLLAACAGTLALVACGSSPKTPPPLPTVTRIMVIPVAPIAKLHTENKGIPLGVLWQSIADRVKGADFNERMESVRKDMGPKLTAALVEQLNAQGYQAQVLEGVVRPAGSPDNIDLAKLPTSLPVLHVYFNEVGMLSARFSNDYVPRVNVSGYLMGSRNDDTVWTDTIYYGADASGDTPTSVPGNPAYRWSSFGEMVGQPQAVAQGYDAAVTALALRIAKNVRASTSPPR
ncbi:hypothetical protein VLK31_34310 [Variovorax sp. H27-G14]|uniref:hypothetical protein n=1 Tax=Variovorax sp. H27-G14 TaxID=3111914 RepID=UPI0038FC57FE